MNSPKAIGVTLLAVIWGTQNPAEALVNNQGIQSNLTLIPTKLPTTKQSNLVAINDAYW
jgi:hypothetical protein